MRFLFGILFSSKQSLVEPSFPTPTFLRHSVVISLYSIAECCSPQSTFKSEVQSLLLTMIHSLVCKKLSHLLGSTADLWAGDVLEIAKLGAEEKKVTLPAGCKRPSPIWNQKPAI